MSNILDLPAVTNGNIEDVLTYNGKPVVVKLEEVITNLNVCIGDQPLIDKDKMSFDLDSLGPLWTEKYDIKGFLNSLESNEIVWEEKEFLSGEITATFDRLQVSEEDIGELNQQDRFADFVSWITDWDISTNKVEKELVAQIKSVPSVFKKFQRRQKKVA